MKPCMEWNRKGQALPSDQQIKSYKKNQCSFRRKLIYRQNTKKISYMIQTEGGGGGEKEVPIHFFPSIVKKSRHRILQ